MKRAPVDVGKKGASKPKRFVEDPRQAQFGRLVFMLEDDLKAETALEELVEFNIEQTKTATDGVVNIKLLPDTSTGDDDDDDEDKGVLVAVPRFWFRGATAGQEVPMGPGTTNKDVDNFRAWCGSLLMVRSFQFTTPGFRYSWAWAWVPRVFSALGFKSMGGVYAHHPRHRVLQLRHLQRTRPDQADLWAVAFMPARVPVTRKHLFAPLRTSQNKFRLNGRVWSVASRIKSRPDFEALLAAWDASDATLTPRERWALIASALAFEAWPVARVLCDILVVPLQLGSAADRRFREVLSPRVLSITTVEDWPAELGTDTSRVCPWFVPEGRYLEVTREITSCSVPDAFEALTVFGRDGGRLRGVVFGGCVASIMSTHWLTPEEECPSSSSSSSSSPCPDGCPCRLAKDVDVFTTNKSFEGVAAELTGVPGVDITQTPFSSVARLFVSADFTHNQGAVLVAPDGALWIAGTPYAFASWATMHTLATGSRCRTGRTSKAVAKGFTPHMCGVKETPERPYHPSDGNPKSRVCW
jgi:hypothetical protein